MNKSDAPLTDALAQAIVAYIRVGGYPHVAAEAAGVPRATFERWRRRGQRRDAPEIYRNFTAAVRQAIAQARLTAELAAMKGRPLDWLRCGPGKETARNPGWTATTRAAPRMKPSSANASPDRLISALLDLLAPYPEARAAVAAALVQEEITPTETTEQRSDGRSKGVR
jgi:hypothetical protein